MQQGDEVPTHSCATAPDFHRLRHVKSRSNADTMELRKGHSTTAYDAARGRRPLRSLPPCSNHGSKQQPRAPSLPSRKNGLIVIGTLPPQPGPRVSPHPQRGPLTGRVVQRTLPSRGRMASRQLPPGTQERPPSVKVTLPRSSTVSGRGRQKPSLAHRSANSLWTLQERLFYVPVLGCWVRIQGPSV